MKDKNQNGLQYSFFESSLALLEKGDFVENLSTLASSGMSINYALASVIADLKSGFFKNVCKKMLQEIEGGSPLWRAMEHSRVFNENIVSLVRIGEETGRLKENLRVVAMQEQKEKDFSDRVRSAMIYPALVFFTTIAVGVGISWFILPKLILVFSGMHMQLPLLTQWMLAFAGFLSVKGAVVVPAILAGLAFLIYLVFFFPQTRFIGQWILLLLPGIHNLIVEIETARFGFLLGTLLQAGVSIDMALESLRKSADIHAYRKFYQKMRELIIDGYSFEQVFKKEKAAKNLVPMPVRRMVVAAEQSGNLSEVLVRVGQIYEEKIETTTKDLSVILEPFLLIVVASGVLVVALAVIMPIYNLIGGLNNDINRTGQIPNEASKPVEQSTPVPSNSSTTVTSTPANAATSSTEVSTSSKPLPRKVIINDSSVDHVNFRQAPDLGASIIGQAKAGEIFDIKGLVDGWYQVSLSDGQTGWVRQKFAKDYVGLEP